MSNAVPWKLSLHGGHSRDFCDHAVSTLHEILDAAVAFGYRTFGVAEHAPRTEARYLYEEEIAMGWQVETLDHTFREYADAVDRAKKDYEGRLQVLKAFEAEVVPPERYPEIMLAYKNNLHFDYLIGSVHYVNDIIIDYKTDYFEQALETCGGPENLVVRYFQTLADMVMHLRPEVVGHFDLIRKGFPASWGLESSRIMAAAGEALEVIREQQALLEINTAGYRKGFSYPYPAPAFVHMARDMGIPFCFGDDSHATEHVGAGIEKAREYLLSMNISRITSLERGTQGLNRIEVPLCVSDSNVSPT